MSGDSFLATLLSENSNGPFAQATSYLRCAEKEPVNEELSFQGLIMPKNNLNNIKKNECAEGCNHSHIDAVRSPLEDGHSNDSMEEKRTYEADILTEDVVNPVSKKGIIDGSNNLTDIEVSITKEAMCNSEENICTNDFTEKITDQGHQSGTFFENHPDESNLKMEVNITKEAVFNEVIVNSVAAPDELNGCNGVSPPESVIDLDTQNQNYREELDSSDDESSCSTFSLSSSSDCSDSFLDKMHKSCPSNKAHNIKTKGELDLDELPPIEDLSITVSAKEMQKIGSIYAVVDKLVIIRALKDLQPLDIDSVLFLSYKAPLGRIFDVFGPVVEPFYSVRFNSPQHIVDKSISIDADVFFAPEKKDITSYVFVDQLIKQKGSDASWQDNNEPPEEHIDYSDDEEERAAKRKRQAKNRSRHNEEEDVQIIPRKISHRYGDALGSQSQDDKPKNNYSSPQQSWTKPANNPFRTPYSHSSSQGVATTSFARSNIAAVMTSKYPPASYENRISSASSQHATLGSQQNLTAFQQAPCPPSPASLPFRQNLVVARQTAVAEPPRFFQSPQGLITLNQIPPLQPPSPFQPVLSLVQQPQQQTFVSQPQQQAYVSQSQQQTFASQAQQQKFVSHALQQPFMSQPHQQSFVSQPHQQSFVSQPHQQSFVSQPQASLAPTIAAALQQYHIFGHPSFINHTLRPPVGIQTQVAGQPAQLFAAYQAQSGYYNLNFVGQDPNQMSQAQDLFSQTPNIIHQAPNLVSQAQNTMNQAPNIMSQAPLMTREALNLMNQSPVLAQSHLRLQWQQGQPAVSPNRLAPLSVNIPTSPPPFNSQYSMLPPYNSFRPQRY